MTSEYEIAGPKNGGKSMNDKQRPQCENVIDYHPTGMEIIEISPPIQCPTPIQHCTWMLQVQSFIVRKEQSFTDAQGVFQKRQPLQFSCQTIYPQVIQTLATLKCGDKVDIIGTIHTLLPGVCRGWHARWRSVCYTRLREQTYHVSKGAGHSALSRALEGCKRCSILPRQR